MGYEIYLVIYCTACVVINLAYEGTLKSHLTVIKEPKPIETLTELATETSGDIIFINPELNDFLNILKTSPFEKLRTLSEDRNVVGRRTSYLDLFKEALQGHTVVSTGFLTAYEIRRQLSYADGSTDMRIVPQPFTHYPLGYHMPRMNRFNGLINKRIFQLIESGHIKEIFKKVLDKVEAIPLVRNVEDTSLSNLEVTLQPLDINAFLLLIGAYATGHILALIAFLFEYFRIRIGTEEDSRRKAFLGNLNVL